MSQLGVSRLYPLTVFMEHEHSYKPLFIMENLKYIKSRELTLPK